MPQCPHATSSLLLVVGEDTFRPCLKEEGHEGAHEYEPTRTGDQYNLIHPLGTPEGQANFLSKLVRRWSRVMGKEVS